MTQVHVLIGESYYEPSRVLGVYSEFWRAKEDLDSHMTRYNRYDAYTIETFTLNQSKDSGPKPYTVMR